METRKQNVAFLGPQASYTHQAAISRFPESKHNIIPQPTIEDIFVAVQSETSSYGVVPLENSSNGSVVFTLDLLADLKSRHPDTQVCGEIYIPVHHCLLGHAQPSQSDATKSDTKAQSLSQPGTPGPNGSTKPSTTPLNSISHIKKLYSHPQAWGQCKNFLSAYTKGLERQDVSSTSKAAELVAQDTSGTSAAISSKMAAGVNGLDVLAEGIEDDEGNCTRFFVLRKRRRGDDDDEGDDVGGERERERERDDYKTLVLFTVEHGEPGALADCLSVFKKHGLNLTSINTRPSGEAPWHYVFLVELIGRKRAAERGGAVNNALAELEGVAKSCRWLGSWKNALSD